jgi:glycosyltransferase involved in cell wall biosynthesis
LHIIGAGENLIKLVDALQSNGVESVCHGVIFDVDAKRTIFEQCDFGLNVYKPEVGVTMSLKSVEYLSVGLPILNNAFADIRNIISERNAGINFDKEYLEETVERLLNVTVEQIEDMRRNCLNVYEDKYISQNLDSILSNCIEISSY